MTLPPPLTPADSDLRDFRFMPLDVVRFAQSDLLAENEDPAAVVAAILLWGAAWHGKPAGSLTNDDRALARAAGYGKGLTDWLAVKEEAMRGFVLCSDGRLYHPVVAEKVREAWLGKLKQRHRTFCATIRKHNERNRHDTREAPSFEEWLEHGQPREINPAQRPMQQAEMPLDDDIVTRDDPHMSRVTDPPCHADLYPENASKGQGRDREGTGKGDSIESQPTDSTREIESEGVDRSNELSREMLADLLLRVARAGTVTLRPDRPAAYLRELDILKGWIADGIDVETTVLPTITRVLASTTEDRLSSLKFYDTAIRKAHATAKPKSAPSSGPRAILIDARDDDDPRVEQIRDGIRREIGGPIYDQWLGPKVAAFALNGNGDHVVITAASAFGKSWIETHFLKKLRTVSRAPLGLGTRYPEIEIIVETPAH